MRLMRSILFHYVNVVLQLGAVIVSILEILQLEFINCLSFFHNKQWRHVGKSLELNSQLNFEALIIKLQRRLKPNSNFIFSPEISDIPFQQLDIYMHYIQHTTHYNQIDAVTLYYNIATSMVYGVYTYACTYPISI